MNDESAKLQERPQKNTPESSTIKQKYKFNIWLKILAGLVVFCVIFVIIAAVIPEEEFEEQPQTIQPAISQIPTKSYVEDQLIIKYKKGVSNEVINEHLNRLNASIVKKLDAIHRLVIKTPKGWGDAILKKLQEDNLIENAEHDYWNRVDYIPNDPLFNLQWHLVNKGQSISGQAGTVNADIDADRAWDVTKGGVKVAVIDTGVDASHPDLSSKIVLKQSFYGGGTDDRFGHGTHVAGIIAATADNNTGVSGVCPNCQLMIAKALDDNGIGPDSAWIDAFTWAADNGAKVINMSFGGASGTQAKQDAINYAWDKGVITVAASGNSGVNQQYFPCANVNVVCVGATDNKDKKATFSNYGNWVDVAAPGAKIFSTLPTTQSVLQQQKGLQTSYGALDGTSMAAPIVAGVAGLVWTSSYGSTAQAVVDRIFNTVDSIQGTGTYWTKGRVNAAKAVGASDMTPTPTVTPTSTPTPTIQPTVIHPPTPPNNPSVVPTSPNSMPSIYCMGAPCKVTVTPYKPLITPPSSPQQNSPAPSGGETHSSPTSVNTPEPTGPASSQQENKKKDLLRKVLDLIRKILNLMLNLFKGLS